MPLSSVAAGDRPLRATVGKTRVATSLRAHQGVRVEALAAEKRQPAPGTPPDIAIDLLDP